MPAFDTLITNNPVVPFPGVPVVHYYQVVIFSFVVAALKH